MFTPAASHLPAAALQTMTLAADTLTEARDPWWLIGSAAMALHGVPSITIPDIDIIMSVRDAQQILSNLGISATHDGGGTLFRSDVFARWITPPLPVELMGGFRVLTSGGWVAVEPLTREAVSLEGRTLYVPCRQELMGICRLFGRPKDLARAEALSRLP